MEYLAPFIAWLIEKTAPRIAKFFGDVSELGIELWKTSLSMIM